MLVKEVAKKLGITFEMVNECFLVDYTLEHKFFADWESAWLEFSELYTSLVA